MRIRTFFIIATALVGALATTPASAASIPITGLELNPVVGWSPNSTNELNYLQQTPGHIGQHTPYVLLVSRTMNSVTLSFHNGMGGPRPFFEYRIDGIEMGSTPHWNPALTSLDTVFPGVYGPYANGNPILRTFQANGLVEIRLALGPERDYDFNWTAYQVPEPATMALLGLGLVGAGALRRRR